MEHQGGFALGVIDFLEQEKYWTQDKGTGRFDLFSLVRQNVRSERKVRY